MAEKRLLVLASGTAMGGGSGFENLVRKQADFDYKVITVASNHGQGGVRERADRLKIPFLQAEGPWTAELYQWLVHEADAHFVACSGWLKPVCGLDPSTTFNIHPGPLPRFGGKGMYGHHVHEAVLAAHARGELTHTAICMHFVTDFERDGDYDRGPVFFKLVIPILPDDDADRLAYRVNALEHVWQPDITNLVVTGQIRWSGIPGDPVIFPPGYARVQRICC